MKVTAQKAIVLPDLASPSPPLIRVRMHKCITGRDHKFKLTREGNMQTGRPAFENLGAGGLHNGKRKKRGSPVRVFSRLVSVATAA